MKLLNEIKKLIVDSVRGGLFHIVGSSVLAEIGGLISSIVVIRHLPKLIYGQYVDASNLYSYLTVFIGLGLGSAVIQYCSETIPQGEKNSIYRFSFSAGTLFNFVVGLAILALAYIKKLTGQTEVAKYILMMVGLPFVTYSSSILLNVQRVLRANKSYSAVNIVITVTKVLGNIVFTLLWGVAGLIVANYVSQIIATIVSVAILQRKNFWENLKQNRLQLQSNRKREIVRYAGLCSATNFTSTMLSLLDITCLGFVLSDSTILADYQVASVFPAAAIFVPSCLVVYIYPDLVEKISTNLVDASREIVRQFKIFVGVGVVITVGLLVFGPLAIRILYGEKYLSAVPVFRILCINFFVVGGLRKLLGNVIAALKKVSINLIHTLISSGLNIALNLLMIPRMESIGAALATIVSNLVVAILEIIFIRRFLSRETQMPED